MSVTGTDIVFLQPFASILGTRLNLNVAKSRWCNCESLCSSNGLENKKNNKKLCNFLYVWCKEDCPSWRAELLEPFTLTGCKIFRKFLGKYATRRLTMKRVLFLRRSIILSGLKPTYTPFARDLSRTHHEVQRPEMSLLLWT